VERKLAAILAADVAGYRRLTAEDEEAALQTLGAYRQTIGACLVKHLVRRIRRCLGCTGQTAPSGSSP
jgi:class 3 adenylate cyclase